MACEPLSANSFLLEECYGAAWETRRRSPIRIQIVQESIAANRRPAADGSLPRPCRHPTPPAPAPAKRQRFTRRPRYGAMQATFNASDMSQLQSKTEPAPTWSVNPNRPPEPSACFRSDSPEAAPDLTEDPLWQVLEDLQSSILAHDGSLKSTAERPPINHASHLSTEEDPPGQEESPETRIDGSENSRYASDSSSATTPEEPELLLQPETKPISQEQLIQEVKDIYAGLVLVEKKCFDVSNERSANPSVHPTDEANKRSWELSKYLLCLHRDLLLEYHDFFMATHHPIASPTLRSLVNEFKMSDRLLRYGIDSFLQLYPTVNSREAILTFAEYGKCFAKLLGNHLPKIEKEMIEIQAAIDTFIAALQRNDHPTPADASSFTRSSVTTTGVSSIARANRTNIGNHPSNCNTSRNFHNANEAISYGDLFYECHYSCTSLTEWYQWYSNLVVRLAGVGQDRLKRVRETKEKPSDYHSDSGVNIESKGLFRQTAKSFGLAKHITDLLIGWIFYGQSIASHSVGLYINVFQILKLAAEQWQLSPISHLRVRLLRPGE